ncbi:unnamed protein product [Pedinophyceae sp. YPF-701]|nr:unnamed protein product [Pedinophyceae sp. YPF-701]
MRGSVRVTAGSESIYTNRHVHSSDPIKGARRKLANHPVMGSLVPGWDSNSPHAVPNNLVDRDETQEQFRGDINLMRLSKTAHLAHAAHAAHAERPADQRATHPHRDSAATRSDHYPGGPGSAHSSGHGRAAGRPDAPEGRKYPVSRSYTLPKEFMSFALKSAGDASAGTPKKAPARPALERRSAPARHPVARGTRELEDDVVVESPDEDTAEEDAANTTKKFEGCAWWRSMDSANLNDRP